MGGFLHKDLLKGALKGKENFGPQRIIWPNLFNNHPKKGLIGKELSNWFPPGRVGKGRNNQNPSLN